MSPTSYQAALPRNQFGFQTTKSSTNILHDHPACGADAAETNHRRRRLRAGGTQSG